jgi:hypothetical protein
MPACTSDRHTGWRGLVTAALAAGLLLVPRVVLACPVCGASGTTDNAWAYTVMSAMLTLLPLGMIGGAVYWVSRRVSAFDAGAPREFGQDDGNTLRIRHVPEHQDAVQFRAPSDRR